VRQAQLSDLSAITELIRPLEESGTLIPRSKAQLEQEIDRFFVAEVDNTVIGCCARTLIAGWCELSCLAVHPSHQRSHSGESVGSRLLKQVENTAQQSSVVGLYAQTTRARDWFIEQGFCESDLAELPSEVGARYNAKRNSKILTKKFQEA
jgi:amino-acid N-acetyltransferase